MKQYHKFGGRGLRRSGFFSAVRQYSRLYLASDHLLCVDTCYFVESYKRYEFRNIEALWYCPTIGWHLATGLNLVLAVAFSAGLLIPHLAARVVFGALLVVVVIAMAVNLLRGPSCRFYLKTAAHTEHLPSIVRCQKGEALMARLRPLIETAQVEG